MKKTIPLLFMVMFVSHSPGATLAVLPGESIQAKVDLAQPGDIVAIFGGTYPGDITINKAIRLVEVDGEDVTITGNMTWTGVTNAPPFEGFTVGSPGKGITVTNTTGLVLKSMDASAGTNLHVIGTSNVSVVGGIYSAINQEDGFLAVLKSKINGEFLTGSASKQTIALQVSSGSWNWSSARGSISYCTGGKFVCPASNCNVNLCGSSFKWYTEFVYAVAFQGDNNKVQISNCTMEAIFVDYSNYNNFYVHGGGGVYLKNSNSIISNNYIKLLKDTAPLNIDTLDVGNGIQIDAGKSIIINNIISAAKYGISAPFGTKSANNLMHTLYNNVERGGVISEGTVTGDPLFIPDQYPNFRSNSPCLNAGLNDPVFNDLDGSRNDIGPRGGCLYDPEGWTTAKPVVISFDLAPQQLLKGVDTQVTISGGQAVSQP